MGVCLSKQSNLLHEIVTREAPSHGSYSSFELSISELQVRVPKAAGTHTAPNPRLTHRGDAATCCGKKREKLAAPCFALLRDGFALEKFHVGNSVSQLRLQLLL